jgi:hypothetical protein
MAKGEPLDFVAETFQVETCMGEKKVFGQLSTWELLNLKPHTVLDLTDRIYKEYGISSTFMSDIMVSFLGRLSKLTQWLLIWPNQPSE